MSFTALLTCTDAFPAILCFLFARGIQYLWCFEPGGTCATHTYHLLDCVNIVITVDTYYCCYDQLLYLLLIMVIIIVVVVVVIAVAVVVVVISIIIVINVVITIIMVFIPQ